MPEVLSASEEGALLAYLQWLDHAAALMHGVTRYPPGAAIGWHRDAPVFGSQVVGSAYVMSGAARWSWQHSIPAVAGSRFSLTFRTLRMR